MQSNRWVRALVSGLFVILGVASAGYLIAASSGDEPVADGSTPTPTVTEATPTETAETPSDEKVIRIGWTAWSDAEIVTELARRVLEERMGYQVKTVMADIGIQYQGVSSGDLDVMLMAWLPVTHQNYWKEVSGDVVNLGPIYTRARLGWAVPDYIPEGQLSSIEDLRKPEVIEKLGGKIQGIDPGSGLMQASEKAMSEYDLDDLELVSASGAAMTAALDRAMRRDEWIVVTAWNPHWMFAKWDLRYLDDPKGVLGGKERIHVLVRKGFYQDYPAEVTEMLTRMYIPLPELEAALLESTQTSAQHAVQTYLDEHPDRIDYWITGETKEPPPSNTN